ncbi:MAG: hypothetical protein C4583_10705 [Anaerolineaceae bacterium]|nr:MAG: hypothetical protein C4583_10705 [Anaerolineaceae bacterium]
MFQMDIEVFEQVMIFIVLAIAGVALGYALWLRNYIMAADKGNAEMQRHWGHIRDGANAYLRTQLKTVVVMIALLTVAMFLSVFVVSPTPEANEYFDGDKDTARLVIAIARALAFVMGSSFSAMVGFFGMNMAVQGNVRVAAAAERAVLQLEEGHRYFRLGLPDPEREHFDPRKAARQLLEQLQAVRKVIGDRMELMVDLHTRLTPPDAIWFCQRAEELDLFVVEDPLRSEFVAGYRQLRDQTRVPLAAGEQWASKWEFRQAIEENLIDYARMDICIAGGLTEAKKIAAMAEAHLIRILPHNPLGPVCTAASLHLNLAVDNAGPQEVIFHPNRTLPDVFNCNFQLEGTRLNIPDAPGLGVHFNRETALKYPPIDSEPPHFHLEDGTYTNY